MRGSVNLANLGLLEFRLVRGLGAGQWRLWQPLPGVTVAKGPAHDVQALVYHLAIC